MGRSIHKLGRIILGKDQNGKCYLTVIGNDDHTVLIIRNNNSNYEDYKNLMGTKITEEEFKKELDLIQTQRLTKSKISSRFIREEALPLDICKEMNIPLLINYYQYLNDYLNPTIAYDEPENTVGPAQKSNPTASRKHTIIALDDRKKELLKRNPKKLIRFEGTRTGIKFDAYIYEKDGFVLAVVEPESGLSYQYNLNLGEIAISDNALIEEMIKAALEAPEEIVMQDDAMMRKNHTTMATFVENLDIFLENAKATNKFYYDVKSAKSVYRR